MNKLEDYRHHFKENKYTKIYFNLIKKVSLENRILRRKTSKNYVYYEKHHILPRSCFPEISNLTQYKWNKILLLPKEHFIAHLLLCKIFINDSLSYKMVCAFIFMSNKRKLNSNLYHMFVEKRNEIQSKNFKGRPSEKKGKNISIETKLKISKATTGPNNPIYGTTRSQETKEKISKANLGRKHKKKIYINDGHKNFKINPDILEEYLAEGFFKGKKKEGFRPEWWRKNISKSLLGKPHTEEKKKAKSIRYSGSGNPNFGKETSYETKIKMCWKQTKGLYITPWGNFISTKMALNNYKGQDKITVGKIRYWCFLNKNGFSFKKKDDIIIGVDFIL